MRVRRVVGFAVVGLLLAAAAAFAAAGPTGNRRAIAIARAEVRVYSQRPVVVYRNTGFIEMIDTEGKRSSFEFTWGATKLRRGWTWASDENTIALRADRVVWWRDDLTAPRCTRPGVCHRIPAEVVADHRGVYWAFGDASRHTCFARLTGSQPIAVGSRWDRAIGHYSAPQSGSGTVTLTYTYPFGKKITARESDTISSRTDLLKTTRIVLTGGHVIRSTVSNPSTAPNAPRINLCR